MVGTEIAGIVLAVAVAIVVGWRWGRRYRPQHRRGPATPRHLAVSVPRLGSMSLADELTVRGADDPAAVPASDLPWLSAGPAADVAATLSAWLDGDAAGDPECTRLLRTTGEVLRGKLLAEIVTDMDHADQDAAEFMSDLAARFALARLHMLESWPTI